MKSRYVFLFLLLALAVLSQSVFAYGSHEFFGSMRNVDIEHFYDDYALFIDLALYILLFVPLSLQALGKHFGGRHGQKVSLAVGLILSLGLTLMERTMHFNIRSFGPIAAFLVVLVIGVLIYFTVKSLGASEIVSLCIPYILIYFSLQSVTPSLFDWAYERAPWISLLFLLCIVVIAVQGIRRIWPSVTEATRRLFVEEKQVKEVEKITETEIKDTKKMIKLLKRARSSIEKGKAESEATALLEEVQFKEEALVNQAEELK